MVISLTDNRYRRSFGVKLAALGFAGLLLASCGGGASDDASTNGGATPDSAGTSTQDSGGGASGDPIKVGSILDMTGGFSGYGLPMESAAQLAIADINSNGGVLGRPLELISADAQSDVAIYTQEARALATDDEVAVVIGGISSASREAMRPVFKSAQKLYIYPTLYEGGVCDKNTIVTGPTPSQQMEPLLRWAAEQEGLKKWYVLAADYNYGQIAAKWAQVYAEEFGAEIVGGPTFFDLSVNNFSSEIPAIQASGADLIVSLLVGADQDNFYKQWASAGLNQTTTVVSPVFGFGSEQVTVGPAAEGIVAAWPYVAEVESAESSAFKAAWEAAGIKEAITPSAEAVWNAWHLWAAAANAAGSVDRDSVIATIEAGSVEYVGPGGTLKIDPGSHHAIQPMYLVRADGNGKWEVIEQLTPSADPSYEQSVCDLVANPDINQQFEP